MFIALSCVVQFVRAFEATLEWDPNPEDYVAGYRVYWGTASREYRVSCDVGNETVKRVQSLEPGCTYYFAVTAYTDDGLESPFSDEVSYTVAIDGTNAFVMPLSLMRSASSSAVTISFHAHAGQQCYVQASADLQSWQTVSTNVVLFDGVCEWVDEAAPEFQKRFYRVIGSRN